MNFMFELPAILWNQRLNIKNGYQEELEQPNDKDSPSDLEIIDTPAEAPKQSKLDVTPCVLSTGVTSTHKNYQMHFARISRRQTMKNLQSKSFST